MSTRLTHLLLLAPIAACDAFETVPPPPPQEVIVRAVDDLGSPLQNVRFLHLGASSGTTDGDGVYKLSFDGKDGESFEVFVKCPEGFQSPTAPLQVLLRRLASPSRTPEYLVTCRPSLRTVVVAIRADGAPSLPVMHLGREVARTDTSGAGHVVLRVKPDEVFTLVLDTSEKGNERLRPQNPGETFTVKGTDEVFLFEEKFHQEKVVTRIKARSAPVRIEP
ncbi:hypothetical protein ACMHYB_43970 [Sorangium sp. So ce1128]